MDRIVDEDLDTGANETTARMAETIRVEAAALSKLAVGLSDNFAVAVELIESSTGRVIVTGMGKSGNIGRKIAGTLSSVGISSSFLHPSEASHGDLGIIGDNDVAICLSNSGETDEVINLIPQLRRFGVEVIAVTRNASNTLAALADVVLPTGVHNEADPHNLLPTVSTHLQLAVGDALCVELLVRRRLTTEQFASFHPGGTLGQRALLRVSDLMVGISDCPIVDRSASLSESIVIMDSARLGCLVVSTVNGFGVFTDGDLRRLILKSVDLDSAMELLNHSTPLAIGPDRLATEALHRMEQNRVTVLLVIDNSELLGLIHLHQILGSGVR
ncbi:MAG: KpsF/GutQ family sugar-phosphate isomerase [Planctomycetaceae bacterium]|nr:KpsF/GutQ family sugar-phosphate isomerase [Planctomycetaceae bacterium]